MSLALDRRSHRDDDLAHVTPEAFFGDRVPALAAANGHLVAEALEQLAGRPLAVEVGDTTWSLAHDGASSVHAVPHEVDDALTITLTPGEFSAWCQNQRSLNSFLVARTLQYRGGELLDVSMWDSLLMSLLYGWPTVGTVEFRDRAGGDLDLQRCFTPDDDPAEIAHFLREAGFLHLRGWMDNELVPQISADMDRVRPTCVEGDGSSWWAGLADGTRVCVRMQDFVGRSPATETLLRSDLWDQLRRTIGADDHLVQPPIEGHCIEALVKPVGVVSGPSDVNFHRDCHLGRHAYDCSATVVGISLSASDEANGQLRVVPGSHRIAMPVEFAKQRPYLPPLALATEPGDFTVHLSCTLHEATPPRTHERRVMYTNFHLAARGERRLAPGSDLSKLREQVTNILRDNA